MGKVVIRSEFITIIEDLIFFFIKDSGPTVPSFLSSKNVTILALLFLLEIYFSIFSPR